MFFTKNNTRPTVKKVSEIIDKKSHVQKKYISLMFVPSYSTGKTRSLRIPRSLFYFFFISFFVVSAVVTGFYFRSNYFMNMAYQFSSYLDETQEAFLEFQMTAEEEQGRLIEAGYELYEQLNAEQRRHRLESSIRDREHQNALGSLQDQVDDFEELIRAFDEQIQEAVSNLGARAFIAPVGAILEQLEVSQAYLRALSRLEEPTPVDYNEFSQGPNVGFLALPEVYIPVPYATEDELMGRLEILSVELEIQKELLSTLEDYRRRMDVHLRNHPTLWPIRGQITSGFGWRQNPMGGRGGEHHTGIDIRARTGTQIMAAGGGTVTFSGWYGGYGNTIIIDHGFGITTLYAHASRLIANVGQRVERGDVIALVGSTGRSTGPHLHYEVRRNGAAVNPRPFMNE